jgi:Cdc6-like AAA superfamily ATPase
VRREGLYALTLHQRLLLLAIARFFKRVERAYAPLEELRGEYEAACEEYGVEAEGGLKEDVEALHSQGLVTLKGGLVGLLDAPAYMVERAVEELLATGRLRWPP